MLVLVADDDAGTTTLVSAILHEAGFQTAVARDAMQVLALATNRKPDAIVLDLQMPAGTGMGALEKLKMSSRTTTIPVIVLSGTADAAKVEQVHRLGAVTFLPKPVDADALVAAVRAAVGPAEG